MQNMAKVSLNQLLEVIRGGIGGIATNGTIMEVEIVNRSGNHP